MMSTLISILLLQVSMQAVIGQDMKYILVAGGFLESDRRMEVIDSNGQTRVCDVKMNFPLQVTFASGAATDDKIVICGGTDEEYNFQSQCYVYDGDRKWSELAEMTQSRDSSASIPIANGILVTGGNDNGYTVKTTNIVSLNGSIKEGNPLPERRWGHCLASFNNHIISTGGFNRGSTSNVWVFSYYGDELKLKSETKMLQSRYMHGCAIFSSDQHGGRPLLVVAGTEGSEYWDYTMPNSKWQLTSQKLPVRMPGPRITKTGNGRGLIMTYKKGIYRFHCDSSDSCYWIKDANELKISRRHHVFLTIPAKLVEDC